MQITRRYIAERNRSYGGIQIIHKEGTISKSQLQELESECLGQVMANEEEDCVMMMPLSTGEFAISMCQMVNRTERESRRHEVIHGMVVSVKEMKVICHYLASGSGKSIFFPNGVDSKQIEKWDLVELDEAYKNEDLVKFILECKAGKYGALSQNLSSISKQDKKILIVNTPSRKRMGLMALLCELSLETNHPISMICNGECTDKMINVVISDNLNRSSATRYEKKTLEELKLVGEIDLHGLTEVDLKVEDLDEACDRSIETLVSSCIHYIKDPVMTEYSINDKIEDFKKFEGKDYDRFISKLTEELQRLLITKEQLERFMKMLFFVYKQEINTMKQSKGIDLAPMTYDYQGMYIFLKNKSKNKRELKLYLEVLFEVQTFGVLDMVVSMNPEKRNVAKRAAKQIETKWLNEGV